MAALLPLETLANLVNIGTLFAFILVAIGVIILRHTRPDLERSFRTPLVPLVPILSVLASFYLMLNLTTATWVRFFVWMAAGLVIYAVYGARHSRLGAEGSQDTEREQDVSLDARDQTSAGQRR
jgi:APA family basic amino acid/polyamine antiporter